MAYIPKPYDIAGFDVIGHRQNDGTIILGMNESSGTPMPDFPEEITVNGLTYALEEKKVQGGESTLEWGVYL